MFDFMNTRRPCFLYVNDLAAYRDDRNFTFDLEKLPFVRAEDNDELEKIILDYDANARMAAVDAFEQEFGIVENGTATQQVVEFLEKRREQFSGKQP
jgi:CDP-glycerol glycerophosphotransferase